MLDELPSVLVVFNHPLWTQTCVGVQRDSQDLDRFLSYAAHFLHAFEINATRSTKENNRVVKLAEQWQRPLVSGGDRHGCAASGALNLTEAETFCEFVSEIRQEQRSHVLLMPQYTEPVTIRTTRTLLDVIRNYPEYPIGSRRWDERIFHPDGNGGPDRPFPRCGRRRRSMWSRSCRGSGCWRTRRCNSAMQCLFQAKVSEQPRGDGARDYFGGRSGIVRGAVVKKESARVAYFPCVYHEMDGVAQTSRHFEAFALRQQRPFLMVHAGPQA